MKNIHVLPTDKPSRLYFYKENAYPTQYGLRSLKSLPFNDSFTNQNIYITSDEEIKEGDWTLMFDDSGNLFLCDKPQQYLGIEKGHHLNKGLRKVTLTTDPELIKDGIQEIDDEFLEWFVKNPSCESVEVVSAKTIPALQLTGNGHCWWKIIIPKEEPKQECLVTKSMQLDAELAYKSLPKQETLEEVAYKLFSTMPSEISTSTAKYKALELAKWQQEQDKNKYGEEEVLKLILTSGKLPFANNEERIQWFEQFKKK
jgi:hypothetical protein